MEISGFLDKLKKKVAVTVPSVPVTGCSLEEIQLLEAQLGFQVPLAYKEFLLWMGKDGGPLLRGSDCFYEDIANIQKWSVELLQENSMPFSLPEDAFVFFMHQGYQFAFVRLSEGENSPAYFYYEGKVHDDVVVFAESYTAFLTIHVESDLDYWQKNPYWYSNENRI